MEARASFGRTGFSKGLIALVAVLITLGLAVMAAAVAKNVSGSSATQTHTVSAPASAPVLTQPAKRGGPQEFDGSATSSAQAGLPRPAPSHGRLP